MKTRAASPSQNEIKVTPKMLAAGAAILNDSYLSNGRYDLRDEVIASVFKAMYRQMRKVPQKRARATAPADNGVF